MLEIQTDKFLASFYRATRMRSADYACSCIPSKHILIFYRRVATPF